MVNPEHMSELRQEVESWNQWRKKNPCIQVDISQVNLRDFNRSGINLSQVNLSGTNLIRANLVFANLEGANLTETNLALANLRNTKLQNSNIQSANIQSANLSNSNLNNANLSNVNLINSYCDEANFEGANLSNANLTEIQALNTNFKGAILTGACIENWNISRRTNLDNVICEYIYLERNQKGRIPHDPERIFKPGEFTKYIEKALNTVDLIFTDGIDWKAFFASFQTLQDKYGGDNIGVQAIEKKSGDTFIVRIEVPPDSNKAEIEGKAKQLYDNKLLQLEAEYRAELRAIDKEINIYKQQSADMFEIVKLQASRPITVEAKAVAENKSKNVEVEMNFHDSVTGAAGKVEGNQNIYNSPQEKTLAQAAEEIQKLLKQLEQTNPTATVEQQKAYVDAAIPPTIKERCVGALKAGVETGIEEFLDNPYINVGKEIVKAWRKP